MGAKKTRAHQIVFDICANARANTRQWKITNKTKSTDSCISNSSRNFIQTREPCWHSYHGVNYQKTNSSLPHTHLYIHTCLRTRGANYIWRSRQEGWVHLTKRAYLKSLLGLGLGASIYFTMNEDKLLYLLSSTIIGCDRKVMQTANFTENS